MKKYFFLMSFLGFLFLVQCASAATGDIEGFAWGGGVTTNPSGYGGIGWISTNNRDCDTDGNNLIDNAVCGVVGSSIPTYAVNIPASDGNLSGYAWSEHYGWISFNASDVVGCPVGVCFARKVGDDIFGWARILAIRDAGANAGGWQGWISLNDANNGGSLYGLQISRMDRSGANPTYSYSDELGWIDFSRSGYGADYRICPASMTLAEAETRQLRAYYKASGVVDCLNTANASDVTSLVTWSSSVPAKATVSVGTVTGISAGSSVITTGIYNGKTAPSVTANVICASDYIILCSAQSGNYCPTETISITDRCGATTNSCVGTRNCDYNWKEIAP